MSQACDLSSVNRPPWELVETLPWSDRERIDHWDRRVAMMVSAAERVDALVGRALVLYWASAVGAVEASWDDVHGRVIDDIATAEQLARQDGDAGVVTTALLGRLYACWGPSDPDDRRRILDELNRLRPKVLDQELRLRVLEWQVLDRFDSGDIDAAREWIDEFVAEARGIESKLFARREILWRANIEMLEGRIDEAVRLNEVAIANTADLAGSPFSFQNVAVTTAIALFFRRGLADLVDAIRSIRASSPRVGSNWDVGLAFALSEAGELDEAREIFESAARHGFATIPRDLNWVVTFQLLGLIAINLDDRPRALEILELLRPYGELDGTHGSGYASYGPVGRVVGGLALLGGELREADAWFEYVLSTRGPGPWSSLTRLDRAVAHSAIDPAGALADAAQAEAEFRAFGIAARVDDAHRLVTDLWLAGHAGPIARLAGDEWTLVHGSGGCVVPESVGMGYLVRLLANPGESFDVLTLDTKVDTSLPRDSTAESSLDPSAQRAYRRRLAELDTIDERSSAETGEREFLRRELTGARHRPSSSKEVEKARVRVTRAIRRAIAAVSDDAPRLGAHLDSSIETGRQCLYQPVDGCEWRIDT